MMLSAHCSLNAPDSAIIILKRASLIFSCFFARGAMFMGSHFVDAVISAFPRL